MNNGLFFDLVLRSVDKCRLTQHFSRPSEGLGGYWESYHATPIVREADQEGIKKSP